jgi:hypothetical protein
MNKRNLFRYVYFLFQKSKYRLHAERNSTDIYIYVRLTSCTTDPGLANTHDTCTKRSISYLCAVWTPERPVDLSCSGGAIAEIPSRPAVRFGFLRPTARSTVTLLLQKYAGQCAVTQWIKAPLIFIPTSALFHYNEIQSPERMTWRFFEARATGRVVFNNGLA